MIREWQDETATPRDFYLWPWMVFLKHRVAFED